MNNVFEFKSALIDEYAKFSTSFAKPSAEDIVARLKEEYESGRYWREPLIQINPNYEKDKTVDELAAKGDLTAECAAIFRLFKQEVKNHVSGFTTLPLRLYKHQRQAISHVKSGESYVVTTGTGSGKSLCFFIPIVNRIIEEKKSDPTPRTRAIIVYPMNALANSQREEMRKFLCDYAEGDAPISICRYTGQESQEERDRIRENPPDILLTNYMMLDLILTRHTGDQVVVQNCQGLEFLVLDELHTYRGRQGADVAMLVRRLRAQLNASKLLCVGTSATMAGVGQAGDKRKAISEVASRIFDAPITEHCVVDETLEYVTDKAISNAAMRAALPARVAASSYDWADLDAFKKDPFAVWIERTLGIVDVNGHLERATPITAQDAAEKLADICKIDVKVARESIVKFLVAMQQKEWGESAKTPFAFKLHQFISGPGVVMTTLEKRGERVVTLDEQRFAPGRQAEGALLYRTYFCRECGREYIPVWIDDKNGMVVPRKLDDTPPDSERKNIRYGFLTPIEGLPDGLDKPSLNDRLSESAYPDECFTFNHKGQKQTLKDSFAKEYARPIAVSLRPNGEFAANAAPTHWLWRGHYRLCLACKNVNAANGRDANRLAGISGESRSTATTIITLEALRLMFAEHPVAGNDDFRKLLGFADNRQDCALQSGHFNEFVLLTTVRSALLKALEESPNGIGAEEIAERVFNALSFNMDDPAVKREYLTDPDLFGSALVKACEKVKFYLGYRLFEDLGREWRYRNPNLEQLGLLSFDFSGLDELVSREGAWDASADHFKGLKEGLDLLLALSYEKKRTFIVAVLTALRKLKSISVKYFSESEQGKKRDVQNSDGNTVILDRWCLRSSRPLVHEKTTLIYFNKDTISANTEQERILKTIDEDAVFKASSASAFFRSVEINDLWDGTAFASPNGGRFSGNRRHLMKAVQAVVLAASKAGLTVAHVVGRPKDANGNEIDGVNIVACSLAGDAIIWKKDTPADESKVNGYFLNLYKNVAAMLGTSSEDSFHAFEAHEHTAQVEGDLRRLLEQRFRFGARDKSDYKKDGNKGELKKLPVLYCSPTMELGVDISALDLVYMRNVPPTPANYAQRAGRAGRSGQAALAVTYCASQSPHDQWFYNNPSEMVSGSVMVPAIDLSNKDLFDSHMHAVWLSCVNAELPFGIYQLLDTNSKDDPSLALLDKFKTAFTNPDAISSACVIAGKITDKLVSEGELTPDKAPWFTGAYLKTLIAESCQKFDAALDRWRALYKATLRQQKEAHRIEETAPNKKERETAHNVSTDALEQINVLTSAQKENSDFYLYRYLASQGFLPGYSFPKLPLIAWLSKRQFVRAGAVASGAGRGTMISRPRFLALTEFGPRSLIYHEGAIYRVTKVKLKANELTHVAADGRLMTMQGYVCSNCGYAMFNLDKPSEPPVYSVCPSCREPIDLAKSLIQDLYGVETVEAHEAARITVMDEERQRQGFETQITYSMANDTSYARKDAQICTDDGREAKLTYVPAATIWKINRGLRRRANPYELGFWINPYTGQWSKRDDDDGAEEPKDPNAAVKKEVRIVPFVRDTKNMLVVEPPPQIVESRETMSTFRAALQRGIERVFQLESSELAAEYLPNNDDPSRILLYEASEGGSGVLSRLVDEAQREVCFREIAKKALEVMHYHLDSATGGYEEEADVKCQAGCYECLLSYHNQTEHDFINRRNAVVKDYLVTLANLAPGSIVSVSTTPVSKIDVANTPFLREIQNRKLPFPKHNGKVVGEGEDAFTIDALYDDANLIVTYSPPSHQLSEYASDQGLDILEFPADESQYDAFFAAFKEIVKKD